MEKKSHLIHLAGTQRFYKMKGAWRMHPVWRCPWLQGPSATLFIKRLLISVRQVGSNYQSPVTFSWMDSVMRQWEVLKCGSTHYPNLLFLPISPPPHINNSISWLLNFVVSFDHKSLNNYSLRSANKRQLDVPFVAKV